MASEPPVVTETRSLSIRQVSNGFILSGSVMTLTVTPPATQGYTTQTSTEVVTTTVVEAMDAANRFMDGGPLDQPVSKRSK